jgi:hypothetical protein
MVPVNRIFGVLASFAIVFLLATMLMGFSLRSGNLRDASDRAEQRQATVHRLSGVAAGLVVLLVNSIVVTYFIGTSRWTKEVVDTYSLDEKLTGRGNRLKRATFPISVVSMLIIVGIVALGGAADPGSSPTANIEPIQGITWGNVHFLAAGLGIAAISYGFLLQWNNIRANQTVIADVLVEVKRIRTERGLDD